jgi:hypothetical protein
MALLKFKVKGIWRAMGLLESKSAYIKYRETTTITPITEKQFGSIMANIQTIVSQLDT